MMKLDYVQLKFEAYARMVYHNWVILSMVRYDFKHYPWACILFILRHCTTQPAPQDPALLRCCPHQLVPARLAVAAWSLVWAPVSPVRMASSPAPNYQLVVRSYAACLPRNLVQMERCRSSRQPRLSWSRCSHFTRKPTSQWWATSVRATRW